MQRCALTCPGCLLYASDVLTPSLLRPEGPLEAETATPCVTAGDTE